MSTKTTEPLKLLEFLRQDEELEAFITGPAGSGKTTILNSYIQEIDKLGINYRVVAYTHKAKDVLISKLPPDTPVSTLHSWLKKTPGINSKAKHIKHLMTNYQVGKPEHLQLLIVDEFSFVGEKDYMDIGELQDPLALSYLQCSRCRKIIEEPEDTVEGYMPHRDCTCSRCRSPLVEMTIPPLKVLYVGDLNQLSPVDGPPAVQPHGPYWTELKVVHRTHNTLTQPLKELVDMIEGRRKMSYLQPTEDFIRGVDIVQAYKEDPNPDKIILAYTNQRVQSINAQLQGRPSPLPGDTIYNLTMKKSGTIVEIHDRCKYLDVLITPRGPIDHYSRYNPMKLLDTLDYVRYYELDNGTIIPGIFGMYENKVVRERIGNDLVNANKAEKDSSKLYHLYKTINDFVSVIDFDHCVTIHKSQGSEFSHVYVDSKDLSKCIDKTERMKLLYVSISRAKDKCFLSN